MADTENPQQPTSASYNQPNWKVETVYQTVVVQGGATPEEMTPERLTAIETRYRAQVIERYNRLGFAGLGLGDLRLSAVALNDVFVRLTLTVEKTVREPIPPEEWEHEGRSRSSFHWGGKKDESAKESDRPRERIITVQEPISLSDALAQHALIVGEPGAGKSTLLRWLAVTFAAGNQREAERLGPQAEADRLPLLVELGRLPEVYLQAESRETLNWKLFLPEHLTKQPPFDDIPAAFLAQALAAGRCLLLCDGLDEIADLTARRRIADSLADYARSSANRLVLSSRPAGVSGSEASLGARFQRSTIQRFAPEDVRRFFGFLCGQYEELTSVEQAKEADALYAAVQAAPKTLELATTPLLATLLLLLWNQDGYLPERRVELYERCCQMLMESWEAQHDVAYTGALREIGWERHLRLLAPLAYAIHNTGQRTDAPASELIPVLAQAMQDEGLAAPASATLEAEKFLRTLSLRSGLLQFLGADRYGFPHLTFQEYLTARHIAAQPDPDYIDLVMVNLHKAWWREVHLLVIGHLASGSEGADKASWLLRFILHVYEPPSRLLRSTHFNPWAPNWLLTLQNTTKDHRILKWPFVVLIAGIMILSNLPIFVMDLLSKWIDWQFERRLAWVLAREFMFVVEVCIESKIFITAIDLCPSLADDAKKFLLHIILDPGRIEDGDSTPLYAAMSVLNRLDVGLDGVTAELLAMLGCHESIIKADAATSLGALGVRSEDVVEALVATLGESNDPWGAAKQAAAFSIGQLNVKSPAVITALITALNDTQPVVRRAAAINLGFVGTESIDAKVGLITAISDPDPVVNQEAVRSLGQMLQDSSGIATVLIEALNDSDSDMRRVAANSLGVLGESSSTVVMALTSALGDPDSTVRENAASSLAQLGKSSKEVVSVLLEALKDSDSNVQQTAAISLGQVGESSKDIVDALNEVLHDSDSDVRQAAASSLGLLGVEHEDVLKILVTALSDIDWTKREVAAKALNNLGDKSSEVVTALMDALADRWGMPRSIEWGALSQAASTLAKLELALYEVEEVLVDALDDSSIYVQMDAAEGLGKLRIEDETQLSRVLVALNRRLHDRDDDVRQAALTAIRRLLDGRQIPGYRWVPIRERREKARKRRILGYWVIGLAVLLLVAWVAAGVATYLRVDPFIERFVAYALALVALAAGVVQVLGWLRRPPWDR